MNHFSQEKSAASPQRKINPDLYVCSVCGLKWREADDCLNPKDCVWVVKSAVGK